MALSFPGTSAWLRRRSDAPLQNASMEPSPDRWWWSHEAGVKKFAYLIEPSFNYLNELGLFTGCDVELARYVLRQLGVGDVEFVETEFADLQPGLARRDRQMTTGLFATAARQRVALFSRPIWALPDGLLVRSADVSRIRGYGSISDYRNENRPCLTLRIKMLSASLNQAKWPSWTGTKAIFGVRKPKKSRLRLCRPAQDFWRANKRSSSAHQSEWKPLGTALDTRNL
ncbi:transporter substrate-binding domain-containing protein [Roseobacter weihaiensis]|uniref:transporter substrate-binding domain-containing protein n=1 Tax=Roseobacter weihaiensis TaxID=2763262 RepID=UPI003872BBFA